MRKTLKPSRRSLLVGSVMLVAAPMILGGAALAITPEEIKKRGKIIAGSKATTRHGDL
jgi:polar amino acid transport system substrate-binding protein